MLEIPPHHVCQQKNTPAFHSVIAWIILYETPDDSCFHIETTLNNKRTSYIRCWLSFKMGEWRVPVSAFSKWLHYTLFIGRESNLTSTL